VLTIRFFSLVREAVNRGEMTLDWHDGLISVGAVKHHLAKEHGEVWQEALFQPNLVHALNQKVVDEDCPVVDGDELGFFPPMTGG